jgi:hypothetical protein
MRYLSLVSLLTILISSCKTDIDLIGEYQTTPVIYGLLDQSDSLHFIKINKTFLGRGNAFDMALVPDSSYFENVDATVTEILANGNTGRIWPLRDTMIAGKDENGVFFAPEQKVYYFATPTFQNNPALSLKPDAKYVLNVNINDGEFIVKGETSLVRDVGITAPTIQAAFGFISNQNEYRSVPFVWTKGNGKRFNFSMAFHYKEFDINGVQNDKSFNWNLGEFMAGTTNNVNAAASGELFYRLVSENIPQDNTIVKREHTYFLITLVAGSEELHNFITANQPSTSLAQNKPSYTNLEGGIGIFSSRYTIRTIKYFINPDFQNWRSIDQRSTKELCEGQFTGMLKFCSSHIQDNNPNLPNNPQSFVCQ